MEEMDYNLLFRGFVSLNADDLVWDAATFEEALRSLAGSRCSEDV